MCLMALGALGALGAGGGAAAAGAGAAAAGTAAAAAGTAAASAGIWGTIATAATVGSGLLSAYSQVQNNRSMAKAARQTSEAQSAAALEALEQGEQESDRLRARAAQQQGENVVALAAQGVDVSGAQAIDLLGDSALLVEEDAFSIRENARRTAEGYSQQAANSMSQARTYDSNAFFQPIGTALGTVSKVGNKYAAWAVNRGEYA